MSEFVSRETGCFSAALQKNLLTMKGRVLVSVERIYYNNVKVLIRYTVGVVTGITLTAIIERDDLEMAGRLNYMKQEVRNYIIEKPWGRLRGSRQGEKPENSARCFR